MKESNNQQVADISDSSRGIAAPHSRLVDISGVRLAHQLIVHRAVLLAVAKIELGKRYAGSFLGLLWYPIYWAALLGMYCFVYIVIFKQRIPEFGNFGYILFIFSGLVPYFGVSDAIGNGAGSVRSNMAVVRSSSFILDPFVPWLDACWSIDSRFTPFSGKAAPAGCHLP